MSGRVGRDHNRNRRDHNNDRDRGGYHPSPSYQSSSPLPQTSSRGNNSNHNHPPSRTLWVGNLSHRVSKPALTDHFLRFGEIENVSMPPGRAYAFINFVVEDDAVAAMDSLQGFLIAGLPLRIQFAKSEKSEKSAAPPREEMFFQPRDEMQDLNKGSFSKRDSRVRHGSPNVLYPDSSNTGNTTDEPSEILWIGFPSFLKVDDTILRKAFSPFGEIEKITAFSGRTYAFVQFRNLASAIRAKETLQGKLFGNPRVHICFARNDTGPSAASGGRRGMGPNAPPSSHLKHYGEAGSSDRFSPDFGNFTGDAGFRPPQFANLDYEDPEAMGFGRKEHSWATGNDAYEERRFRDLESDLHPPRDRQAYHNGPGRDGPESALFHEISAQRFPRKSQFVEDPWDLPESANLHHAAKKLKTGSFIEDELPEYPLHNSDQGKNAFPRLLPEGETGQPPHKRHPEPPLKFSRPIEDAHNWRSSDNFQSSTSFSASALELKRNTDDLHKPPPKDLWKWEGTIAKGGTPVCRARCFPVGKVMDVYLPEFLDCTARTGLDMLAKHYYQAGGSWVVFFVPASDTDMGFYNEFMNYLGEKERAAVSKLDERHTLFLVPPSEFSEKVLKVPGKLSISGVVLRLEPPSPTAPALPPANEFKDSRTTLYPSADNSLYQNADPPSGPLHSLTSYTYQGKPGVSSSPSQGNVPNVTASTFLGYNHSSGSVLGHMENSHDFQPAQHTPKLGPTWSPHPPQPPALSSRSLAMSQALPGISQEYHPTVSGRSGPEPDLSSYRAGYNGLPEQKISTSIPLPPGGLHPHPHPHPQQTPVSQSSLVGQQEQSISHFSASNAGEFNWSSLMGNNQPANPSVVPHNMSTSMMQQGISHSAGSGKQEVANVGSSGREEEGDPQKRLQATLQLAAALLQQIQQGKGN